MTSKFHCPSNIIQLLINAWRHLLSSVLTHWTEWNETSSCLSICLLAKSFYAIHFRHACSQSTQQKYSADLDEASIANTTRRPLSDCVAYCITVIQYAKRASTIERLIRFASMYWTHNKRYIIMKLRQLSFRRQFCVHYINSNMNHFTAHVRLGNNIPTSMIKC